jgi:DNA-3-methyladenine glycosylase
LSRPLPRHFYDRDPAVVARELLGAVLECRTRAGVASGRIVETEAYLGPHDPACHAAVGLTARTAHLFGPPGRAYVYLIYGMYWCFNTVTERAGIGSAVLVRAVEPVAGLALMRRRRQRGGVRGRAPSRDHALTNGPGKLCAALGIDGRVNGVSLQRGSLVVRAGVRVPDADIAVSPRIGITQAAEWPQRYFVRGNPYVSRTPRTFAVQVFRAL